VLRLASRPFQDQFATLVASTTHSTFGFVLQIVILPLLSSACCGIQLAINALVGAGGCAGFNKYVGPLRQYFLAMLFVATTASFPVHQSKTAIVKWAQYSLLRWSVALMPEVVHLWNVNVGERIQQRSVDITGGGNIVTIEMTIPTMGCVACINKIDSSMRQCAPNRIEEAKAWLEPSGKGGRALVRGIVSSKQDAESLAESLVDAVRGAGFDSCSVDSIRIEGSSEQG
jgi:copper chaperone CopZ